MFYCHFKQCTARLVAIMAFALFFTACDTLFDTESDLATDQLRSDLTLKRQTNGDALAPVCEAALLDLALVLDVSGSMTLSANGKTRLELAKEGATALIEELNSNHQGTLVSFQTTAARLLNLTVMDEAGRNVISTAINGLTAFGFTNTQAGIIFGAEELTGNEALFQNLLTFPSSNARAEATKIMVVLADGESNQYHAPNGSLQGGIAAAATAAIEAADRAKAEGIRIMTIAIGEANVNFMRDLASSPDDAFASDEIDDLVAIFLEIAEAICPQAVEIDIHPGSDPNSININNKGVIPVAVFTTDDFDATQIDPETVRFGALSTLLNGGGATLLNGKGRYEDVDGDGRPDFVGHFPTQDTGFTSGDELGWILGETFNGTAFAGRDAVRILDRGRP
jgi:hypothetical protein